MSFNYQPTNPNYMNMPTYSNTPTASGPATSGPASPNYMGMGAGIGSLVGGLIGGGNYTNPADPAMNYLNQIPGTISPYYNPYIQAGGRSLNTLESTYNKLLNPSQVMQQLGSGFQASPGYEYNVEQATNAANQAAAAGGMQGTMQEQQQLAQTVSGLANQDYYNYLNHVLGIGQAGLGGLSNINQMGYGASNQLAQSLKDVLESQANLSYAGQENANERNAGQGAGWGGLIGGTIGALGSLF